MQAQEQRQRETADQDRGSHQLPLTGIYNINDYQGQTSSSSPGHTRAPLAAAHRSFAPPTAAGHAPPPHLPLAPRSLAARLQAGPARPPHPPLHSVGSSSNRPLALPAPQHAPPAAAALHGQGQAAPLLLTPTPCLRPADHHAPPAAARLGRSPQAARAQQAITTTFLTRARTLASTQLLHSLARLGLAQQLTHYTD
nr:CASP-like protein 4A2 [Lolium perenne]